jgi:hypothetical protein
VGENKEVGQQPDGKPEERMSDGREEREEREKRRELERRRDLEDRVDRNWMDEDRPERRDS